MNGSGIDDAESAAVAGGGAARERVSKNLPVRRAPSVGEKSLMDHSFLFGAAVLLLAYPGDAGAVSRLYPGIKNLCPRMEFPIIPLDAEQRYK